MSTVLICCCVSTVSIVVDELLLLLHAELGPITWRLPYGYTNTYGYGSGIFEYGSGTDGYEKTILCYGYEPGSNMLYPQQTSSPEPLS